MEQHSIASIGGHRLAATHFAPRPEDERGSLTIVHGAFEHRGRHAALAQHLAGQGYHVITFDLRGHGESSGRRMFLRDFHGYIDDLQAVHAHFAQRLPPPYLLLGHSMGGLIALRHRQTHPEREPGRAGTLLSAPYLATRQPIPAWKRGLSKVAVRLAPAISVSADLDANLLSRDPAAVRAYEQDPLVSKQATPGWFEAVQTAQARALQLPAPGPLHIFLPTADRLVDGRVTLRWFRNLPPEASVQLTRLNGFYHEIFHEPEPDEPLRLLMEQLDAWTQPA